MGKGGMAETHVISALNAKYVRIKGQIITKERELEGLRIDLVHVEETIRLFKNDWDDADRLAVAPRKPSRWLRRGQGIRTALDVLREASTPLTAREIALAVMDRLQQPKPSADALERQASTFNGLLRRRIGKGIVRHDGTPWRWSLTPPASNTPSIGVIDATP
jgi:hypothetical protein